MITFKVALHNSAGELGHRQVKLYQDAADGLPYGELIRCIREMLDGAPAHDGDSITVRIAT